MSRSLFHTLTVSRFYFSYVFKEKNMLGFRSFNSVRDWALLVFYAVRSDVLNKFRAIGLGC